MRDIGHAVTAQGTRYPKLLPVTLVCTKMCVIWSVWSQPALQMPSRCHCHLLKPCPTLARLFIAVRHWRKERKESASPGTQGWLEMEEEEKINTAIKETPQLLRYFRERCHLDRVQHFASSWYSKLQGLCRRGVSSVCSRPHIALESKPHSPSQQADLAPGVSTQHAHAV